MFRNLLKTRPSLLVAGLALGASGAVFADDSSMSRFGGESYAYFTSQPAAAKGGAAAVAWRRDHPNGLSERELVALSSSGLSAAADRLDPPAFSSVAADTTWRQTHPNGFTEREDQALSSSSLAPWQSVPGAGATVPMGNMANDAGPGTLSARLKSFLRPDYGVRAAPQ